MGCMTHEVPVTRARAEFADLVNRVVYGHERVVVTRHGRALVALVSAADLDRLDRLDATEAAAEAARPAEPAPAPVVRMPGVDPAVRPATPIRRPFEVAAEYHPPGRRPGPPAR
jgi:prevent-host-death family protein